VYAWKLPLDPEVPPVLLARHAADEIVFGDWRRGGGLFSVDRTGEIFLWSPADGEASSVRRIHRTDFPKTHLLSPDPTGRWIAERPNSNVLKIWNTEGLIGARALRFKRANAWHGTSTHDFEPRGSWVAVTTDGLKEVSLWPLSWPRPFVVDGWMLMNISPDGRSLLTSSWEKTFKERKLSIRLWPLPGGESDDIRDIECPPTFWTGNGLVMDPSGERVLVLGYGGMVALVSVDDGAARHLDGFPNSDLVVAGGFSPSGRFVAAASNISDGQATLRVWDLQNGSVKVFDEPADADAYEGLFAFNLAFVNETRLLTAGANGLLSWSLETGSVETLRSAPRGGIVGMGFAPNAETMLVYEVGPSLNRQGDVDLHDLTTGQTRSLDLPGQGLLTLSADGTVWASGEADGSIWVGRTDGGQPHLLLGHEGFVETLISPDLRWIASSGQEGTLRLWPMPDLSKHPLHTLPHDELLAKLKSLTNLRAVRDEESSTGWKIEVGPFPGWAEAPEW
jgi:WD40 repeat protein